MTLYRVLIEGSGFEFSAEDGTRVRGFVVTRLAKADLETDAAALAQARVADEWSKGKYASFKVHPTLRVSEVERLGLLGRIRVKDTGYVFHPG
jgi:hypothetical protein